MQINYSSTIDELLSEIQALREWLSDPGHTDLQEIRIRRQSIEEKEAEVKRLQVNNLHHQINQQFNSIAI